MNLAAKIIAMLAVGYDITSVSKERLNAPAQSVSRKKRLLVETALRRGYTLKEMLDSKKIRYLSAGDTDSIVWAMGSVVELGRLTEGVESYVTALLSAGVELDADDVLHIRKKIAGVLLLWTGAPADDHYSPEPEEPEPDSSTSTHDGESIEVE